jgi:hypothetical protein
MWEYAKRKVEYQWPRGLKPSSQYDYNNLYYDCFK